MVGGWNMSHMTWGYSRSVGVTYVFINNVSTDALAFVGTRPSANITPN